jgi:hypothetical protein
MSGIVNLESALRTCKVDTAYQQRTQSDRFLNPKNMVCPVWNGLDAAGRIACADSFYTKREGCHSALDRVGVENVQRPQYMQYISDFVSGNNYNYNSGVPAVPGSSIGVEGFQERYGGHHNKKPSMEMEMEMPQEVPKPEGFKPRSKNGCGC